MDTKEEIQKIIFSSFDELFISYIYDNYVVEEVDIFEDLGFESIKFISMIVELESKFSIEIPDEYLSESNFSKVGEIEKIILSIMENEKNGL